MSDDYLYAEPAALAEIKERRFAAMMDLVAQRHPFYRARMAEHGLTRADFASLADLAKLPITTKQDYMNAPEAFRLDGDGLPDEERIVWDTMYTTGSTTGRPTPLVNTTSDFWGVLELSRGMMRIRGVRGDDMIANLFPLTVYPAGAFNRATHAAAVMNVPMFACLPGNPGPRFKVGNHLDEVVRLIEARRATILWTVPSYLRRVLQRAAELGADYSAVRMIFVTGEGLPETARADLIARLKALGSPDPFVSVSYGTTEGGGGFVECRHGSGYHNPAPEHLHTELVDPETHRPVPDGQEGLFLLTHLDRRGTVLLRYAVGDITVRTAAPCPHCGATTERLTQMPRRADALVKIKGMLVNPDLIAEAIAADPAVIDFQAVLTKVVAGDSLSGDRLMLRAVAVGGDADVAARLAATVKRAVGVTPEVELVAADELDPGRGWKAKRFIDRR